MDDNQILPQDAASLIERYLAERKRWVEAGKPLRHPDEISRIFKICQPCEYFNKTGKKSGECLICGCHLKEKSKILNKIAWATTHCPKTPPEWT